MLQSIIITLCLITMAGCTGGRPDEHILFDFESEAELDRLYWTCHTLMSVSDEHVAHGQKALKLVLFPSDYPGFIPKLGINDWSGYKAFCFDIYNPAAKENLVVVRIDDKKEYPEYMDRYNNPFILKSGPNRICIPLNSLVTTGTQRIMNLYSIQRVLIFMDHPVEKNVFFLDYIRLSSA